MKFNQTPLDFNLMLIHIDFVRASLDSVVVFALIQFNINLFGFELHCTIASDRASYKIINALHVFTLHIYFQVWHRLEERKPYRTGFS